ncbi:hypothetical protein [Budvicia aquatica]|uniref:Uncharacterized protein n=1 Tax=Budvicia aquatica TaxID=82979 RepID=A0A2C6DV99_9GAMM|nr:hypothetical protein [Budvicia aquatica]PHI32751.1 hypothetical protein CRN84_18370 [Budvicia aquatica]
MKLRIGVQDIPYGYGDNPDATTFEVATILEDEYSLFSIFFKHYEKEIMREAREAITLQIENHLRFGSVMSDTLILSETEKLFHLFLESEEMAGLSIDKVPTLAAIDGVNSRLKTTSGQRRPSFIDGGLLKTSFIAWIEDDEN